MKYYLSEGNECTQNAEQYAFRNRLKNTSVGCEEMKNTRRRRYV